MFGPHLSNPKFGVDFIFEEFWLPKSTQKAVSNLQVYHINSYPAKCVLAGTTFERIDPPSTNFIALVEVVSDEISTHFQVVTLKGEREFVKFWYYTRILSCSWHSKSWNLQKIAYSYMLHVP